MLAHKVCSITDPFCSQALHQRWPDGTSARTVPYQVRFMLPITTSAAGNVGVMVYPGFVKNNSTDFSQLLITTDFLGTNASFDNSSPLTTQVKTAYSVPSDSQVTQTRVVSHGIRWIPSVTPMLAKGNTIMCQGFALDGLVQAVGYGVPNAWSSWKIGSIRDDTQVLQGYSAPAGPEARTFSSPEGFFPDPNGSTRFAANTKDWTPLNFAVIGAEASSQVGFLEIVFNLELIYSIESTMSAFAPRPSPASGLLTDASNHVLTVMDGVVKSTVASAERAFVNKAASFLEGAANRAGALVGGYFAGPGGFAAGSMSGTSIRGLLRNRGPVLEVD